MYTIYFKVDEIVSDSEPDFDEDDLLDEDDAQFQGNDEEMEEADQSNPTKSTSSTDGSNIKQGGTSAMAPAEEVALVESVLDEVAVKLIEEISFKVMNEDVDPTRSSEEMHETVGIEMDNPDDKDESLPVIWDSQSVQLVQEEAQQVEEEDAGLSDTQAADTPSPRQGGCLHTSPSLLGAPPLAAETEDKHAAQASAGRLADTDQEVMKNTWATDRERLDAALHSPVYEDGDRQEDTVHGC